MQVRERLSPHVSWGPWVRAKSLAPAGCNSCHAWSLGSSELPGIMCHSLLPTVCSDLKLDAC